MARTSKNARRSSSPSLPTEALTPPADELTGQVGGTAEKQAQTPQKKELSSEVIDQIEHFDVLPPRFDRFIFQHIYVFLIGSFSLFELLTILVFLLSYSSFPIGLFLSGSGLEVLITVSFIAVVWRFNIWREDAPKTLCDLIGKKRIYVPDGDVNTPSLRFLKNFRDALASPKRYLLSVLLMALVANLHTYLIVQYISTGRPVGHPNVPVTVLAVVTDLIHVFLLWTGVYCIGIVLYAIFISGRYIRNLVLGEELPKRSPGAVSQKENNPVGTFKLRIQPFHTDMCGGLKVLGNFYFGLVSPIFIGSGLLIGYILFLLSSQKPQSGGGVVEPLVLGLVLFFCLFCLLIFFPVVIFAFILPLRAIHSEMVREAEKDEDAYNARMGELWEQIQSLSKTNQVEAAKSVQEKKAVWESLHSPYPTWPFHFRSKLFSTILGVGGSIIIGVITAALQQYLLPVILKLLVI